MADFERSGCRNLFVKRLSSDDFERLSGSLEAITVQQRDCLGRHGVPAEYVYFPETAVGSVTSQSDPMRLEIGFVGREGFLGIPVVLGDGSWPATTFVQIPGTLLRMPADAFRSAVHDSRTLLDQTLRYVQAYLVQVSQTAVANGSFNVEERLARWLLMALDRVGHVEIALTHDFLAIMLGVRRPGVTVATHVLEGMRAIKATRGRIVVTNRATLEHVAGASYGIAEREYERLTGAALAPIREAREQAVMPDPRSGTLPDLSGQRVPAVEDDDNLAVDTEHAVRDAGGVSSARSARRTWPG